VSNNVKAALWRTLCALIATVLLEGNGHAEDALEWSPETLAQAGIDYANFDLVSRADKQRANYYYFFVIGVMNALWNDGKLCFSSIKGSEVATVVAKYLNDHPERWGEPSAQLIYEALQPTLGCSQKT
jgi:hypothetical protein